MGNQQAPQVRQSHFQRDEPTKEPAVEDAEELEDEQPRINITNKMVERLVEDATLTQDAAAKSIIIPPRGAVKDKMFIDKLESMDEKHSERCGLTIENLNAMAMRIEMRTANMINPEPVCDDCKHDVIQCYNITHETNDSLQCWDTVGDFSKCVQQAAAVRLRARTAKDALDRERRTRHVLRARDHALKDLATATLLD